MKQIYLSLLALALASNTILSQPGSNDFTLSKNTTTLSDLNISYYSNSSSTNFQNTSNNLTDDQDDANDNMEDNDYGDQSMDMVNPFSKIGRSFDGDFPELSEEVFDTLLDYLPSLEKSNLELTYYTIETEDNVDYYNIKFVYNESGQVLTGTVPLEVTKTVEFLGFPEIDSWSGEEEVSNDDAYRLNEVLYSILGSLDYLYYFYPKSVQSLYFGNQMFYKYIIDIEPRGASIEVIIAESEDEGIRIIGVEEIVQDDDYNY